MKSKMEYWQPERILSYTSNLETGGIKRQNRQDSKNIQFSIDLLHLLVMLNIKPGY